MEEINNRLGYRLTLTTADFNEQLRPGGVLNLTVDLQNTGFASIINERPLYIVLVGQDAIPPYKVQLDIDPRHWEPGTATFSAKVHIPSNAEEGDYRLALWLPDGYESLRDNPLYSIQFANENVWDESNGYNILGSINVDKNAAGSYQRGEKFEVIEANSSVERSVVSITPVLPQALKSPVVNAIISNIQISNDADNLYLSFDYTGSDYNAFQMFIDADQDPQTGYLIHGIGAETLFENHTMNIYNGSGNDWNWAPTELLIHFEDMSGQIRWNISRSLLRSSKLDIVFQLVDTNWDIVFVTDQMTYTLK